MAYWQDYWIAAPIVLASLAAGLATFILLDQEDLAADNESGVGQATQARHQVSTKSSDA